MPGKKRFLLGGAGALLPILLSIAIADAAMIGEYLVDQPYELLGYAIRTTVLFAIGGVWAYVQTSEVQPLKVLQLGVVAPAMLTVLVNTANITALRDAEVDGSVSIEIISSAYAQTLPEQPRPRSTLERIIQGLLGR